MRRGKARRGVPPMASPAVAGAAASTTTNVFGAPLIGGLPRPTSGLDDDANAAPSAPAKPFTASAAPVPDWSFSLGGGAADGSASNGGASAPAAPVAAHGGANPFAPAVKPLTAASAAPMGSGASAAATPAVAASGNPFENANPFAAPSGTASRRNSTDAGAISSQQSSSSSSSSGGSAAFGSGIGGFGGGFSFGTAGTAAKSPAYAATSTKSPALSGAAGGSAAATPAAFVFDSFDLSAALPPSTNDAEAAKADAAAPIPPAEWTPAGLTAINAVERTQNSFRFYNLIAANTYESHVQALALAQSCSFDLNSVIADPHSPTGEFAWLSWLTSIEAVGAPNGVEGERLYRKLVADLLNAFLKTGAGPLLNGDGGWPRRASPLQTACFTNSIIADAMLDLPTGPYRDPSNPQKLIVPEFVLRVDGGPKFNGTTIGYAQARWQSGRPDRVARIIARAEDIHASSYTPIATASSLLLSKRPVEVAQPHLVSALKAGDLGAARALLARWREFDLHARHPTGDDARWTLAHLNPALHEDMNPADLAKLRKEFEEVCVLQANYARAVLTALCEPPATSTAIAAAPVPAPPPSSEFQYVGFPRVLAEVVFVYATGIEPTFVELLPISPFHPLASSPEALTKLSRDDADAVKLRRSIEFARLIDRSTFESHTHALAMVDALGAESFNFLLPCLSRAACPKPNPNMPRAIAAKLYPYTKSSLPSASSATSASPAPAASGTVADHKASASATPPLTSAEAATRALAAAKITVDLSHLTATSRDDAHSRAGGPRSAGKKTQPPPRPGMISAWQRWLECHLDRAAPAGAMRDSESATALTRLYVGLFRAFVRQPKGPIRTLFVPRTEQGLAGWTKGLTPLMTAIRARHWPVVSTYLAETDPKPWTTITVPDPSDRTGLQGFGEPSYCDRRPGHYALPLARDVVQEGVREVVWFWDRDADARKVAKLFQLHLPPQERVTMLTLTTVGVVSTMNSYELPGALLKRISDLNPYRPLALYNQPKPLRRELLRAHRSALLNLHDAYLATYGAAAADAVIDSKTDGTAATSKPSSDERSAQRKQAKEQPATRMAGRESRSMGPAMRAAYVAKYQSVHGLTAESLAEHGGEWNTFGAVFPPDLPLGWDDPYLIALLKTGNRSGIKYLCDSRSFDIAWTATDLFGRTFRHVLGRAWPEHHFLGGARAQYETFECYSPWLGEYSASVAAVTDVCDWLLAAATALDRHRVRVRNDLEMTLAWALRNSTACTGQYFTEVANDANGIVFRYLSDVVCEFALDIDPHVSTRVVPVPPSKPVSNAAAFAAIATKKKPPPATKTPRQRDAEAIARLMPKGFHNDVPALSAALTAQQKLALFAYSREEFARNQSRAMREQHRLLRADAAVRVAAAQRDGLPAPVIALPDPLLLQEQNAAVQRLRSARERAEGTVALLERTILTLKESNATAASGAAAAPAVPSAASAATAGADAKQPPAAPGVPAAQSAALPLPPPPSLFGVFNITADAKSCCAARAADIAVRNRDAAWASAQLAAQAEAAAAGGAAARANAAGVPPVAAAAEPLAAAGYAGGGFGQPAGVVAAAAANELGGDDEDEDFGTFSDSENSPTNGQSENEEDPEPPGGVPAAVGAGAAAAGAGAAAAARADNMPKDRVVGGLLLSRIKQNLDREALIGGLELDRAPEAGEHDDDRGDGQADDNDEAAAEAQADDALLEFKRIVEVLRPAAGAAADAAADEVADDDPLIPQQLIGNALAAAPDPELAVPPMNWQLSQ